ncbi:unnamed protein product [Sphenostylis stenocarpa]|uniref:Uncharacterized protein n=1 Tax=Sphenostylis stenocarpa TaxID=92480 RepID=A0AA86SAG0_9FABA|nr:unnamed protein product [Sphenostylis stenocarpa]
MSRTPNYEFQEWWNKQREKNNHVDPLHESKLDHSHSAAPLSYTTLDIDSSSSATAAKKERSRSARQLSWVCLLKFQQLAASLGWLSGGVIHLFRTANRRIADSASLRSDSSRLYRAIRVFLVVVIVLLGFELVAYFKGWHFSRPDPSDFLGLLAVAYAAWLDIRARYLSPPLQSLANLCTILFIVQSVDRVVLILGCFWIKFRRLKPVASVDYDSGGHSVEDFPMVLVQIPMCNEREVRICRLLCPFGTT